MKGKKSILAMTCAIVIASMAGCGGSDDAAPSNAGGGSTGGEGGGGTTLSSSVSGTAMAGKFLSGQTCAYKLAAGKQGDKIACSSFNTDSQFTIDVGNYVGEALLAIEGGAAYDDEATLGDESSGTPLKGTMRSIVTVGANGSVISATITPFTETAVRMASSLTRTAVEEKVKQLQALLPQLDNAFNVLNTRPATGHSDALSMIYRELLRALSQMQTNAKMQGDLGSYLSTLTNTLANGSNTDLEKLKSEIQAAIAQGLDSAYCELKDDYLNCQTTPLPVAALGCKPEYFQPGAAISLPGSMDLVSFSGPYSGSEGVFDNNFNFTKTGDAQLLVGTDAKTFYNGVEYPLDSLCMETNATQGKMLYLHFKQGHIDLFADRSWSGVSPKDGVTIMRGDKPASGGGGGDTGGTPGMGSGVTLSVPVNGFTNIPQSTPVFEQGVTDATFLDRKKWSWQVGTDMNQLKLVVAYVRMAGSPESETLQINVGGGLPIISAPLGNVIGMCTLTPSMAAGQLLKCSDYGVSFDKATGLISMSATPMKVIVGTAADFTLKGSMGFVPF